MKILLHKITAYITPVLMLIAVIVLFSRDSLAEDTPAVTIANAGALCSDAVDINVTLSPNSGLAMMQFKLVFDPSLLALNSASAGTVLADPTIGFSAEDGWIVFVWDDTEETVNEGTIMTLNFTVLAGEGETCDIAFDPSYDNVIFANEEFESVECNLVNGTIESVLLGDIDHNGSVQVSDALLACRAAAKKITLDERQIMAADMDKNTNLNIRDIILICKKIIGI